MANTNSASALYNLTANSSATETAVSLPVGAFNSLGISTSATPVRAIFGVKPDVAGGEFDGHPFKVRVAAQGVASGAGNFVVNVYANLGGNTNLTTFTNDILIIGSGNQALASKSGVVVMEAICLWDSVSQQLCAFWNEAAGIANIATTPAVIKTSAAVTATNPVGTAIASAGSLQFFVTTSISANSTSAKLIEASIEQI